MTANEFRNQTISNTRLAWLVYGHKVSLESIQDFTDQELKDIYHVEDTNEVRLRIVHTLMSRGMSGDEVKQYLA